MRSSSTTPLSGPIRSRLSSAFLLLWMLAAIPAPAEQPLVIEAEALANPLQVFKDPAASQKLCMAFDVSELSGTALNVDFEEKMPTGLYRAGFFMRISSRTEPLAKGLSLKLQMGSSNRPLTYLNLDDAAEYQRFDLIFDQPRETYPTLTLSWQHSPEVHKEALGETVANEKLMDLAPKVLEKEVDEGDGEEEMAILQEGKPLSDAGKIYVALDQVVIEPLTRVARVVSIYPERVHYEPGLDTWAQVTVQNYLGERFEGELALEMRWELVERRDLGQQPVSLEAGATAKVKFPFNVGKEEFGRELRATLLAGGKPVHSASEYFSVSENIWKVGICGAGWSAGGSFGFAQRVDSLVQVNRANYGNFYEEFAWAPSDYDDMTPDTEEFWSGQTQYHGTISDCKAVIDGLHKHGIKAVTYGKSCGGGLPGFETMRKHPDWFIRYDVGLLVEGGPEVDFLDRMRALDYSLAAKDGWQSWQGQWVDSRVEAAVRFGAEEIVRSIDLFGWDGIRWDGQFNAYGENADEISARNTSLVKEICWKKYPKFVHGYNYLLAQMSDKEIQVNPYPMVPMLKDFEECCRDGGLIMNESLRDFSNRNFSHRTMWVFGECMALEGDWVSGLGGYYLAIGFDRATLLDSLYNTIFFLTTGARPYSASGATSLGHFWQFATRYSCLVYDNTRRRLAGADSFIRVESPWPLWWKPYTYLRNLGGNRRQILVNLIGKPVEERFNELKQPPPPLQKNVKVIFRLPQGWVARQAHQVSIELDRFQRPLEMQAQGGEVVLDLPECRYWSMVALDIEGGENAGVFSLTDPVAAARDGFEKQQKAAIEAQKKAAEAAGVKAPEASQPAPPAPTDRDRVAQADFPKVEQPELKRNGERDILLALGAYHWMYEMAEAIGWAGGAAISEAKLNVKGGWFRGAESSMPDLPADFDTIRQFDVLVLNNVPAVFMTLQQRYLISRFVEAGGGLLVIGGEWSLDRGGFQSTLLGDLLPVGLPPPSPAGATLYPDGLPLKPTDDLQLKDAVDWSAEPRIFCLHHVKPKPGARILLTAGDHPLVVEGRSGAGRVIVFAGSTMGLVPPGKLAFWHWDGLPMVFANLFGRLSEGSKEVTKEVPPEVDREQVLESLVGLSDQSEKEQLEVIRQLCAICDREVARGLVSALGSDTPMPPEAYTLIARTVPPFVDQECKSDALEAAHSEIREAKAAATSLLGRAAGEEARDLLVERLQDMDLQVQRAAATALGDLRSRQTIQPLEEKLRTVTVDVKDDDEGTDDVAGLKHDLGVALYHSGHAPALGMLIEANENAAAQIVRFERRREALLEHAGQAFKLTPKERRIWELKIQRCGQRKAWWAGESRRLSRELHQIPSEWLSGVFEKAATVNEPASVSLLGAVLGRLQANEQAARFVPLVAAQNTILRMLALQRVLAFGNAADKSAAALLLQQMASAPHHFDRLYALRRVGLLPADARTAMLSAFLSDPQPEVRLTARALLYHVQDEAKRAELSKIRSKYDDFVTFD